MDAASGIAKSELETRTVREVTWPIIPLCFNVYASRRGNWEVMRRTQQSGRR